MDSMPAIYCIWPDEAQMSGDGQTSYIRVLFRYAGHGRSTTTTGTRDERSAAVAFCE